ncbi:MAG: hypothetical protein M2R45_03474 [Verrucomicrobia subdivision 3 bacterium]|nr:hypothetical protein [Limisphaerales bacterium]MCS1416675.1 hypothetical protein [Limisphaerales bacterium]
MSNPVPLTPIQQLTLANNIASALDTFLTLDDLAGASIDSLTLDANSLREGTFESGNTGQRESFWELGRHQKRDRSQWMTLRPSPMEMHIQPPSDGPIRDHQPKPIPASVTKFTPRTSHPLITTISSDNGKLNLTNPPIITK